MASIGVYKNINSESHRFIGRVLYKKMPKTGAMMIERFWKHPKYGVRIRTKKKIFFHDENEVCSVGDIIEITQAPKKISKTKAFVLNKVLEKSPVVVAMEKDGIANAHAAMEKLREMERGITSEINVRRQKNHPEEDRKRYELKMKMRQQQRQAEEQDDATEEKRE